MGATGMFQSEAIKVVSFNLRKDSKHDKCNRWMNRKELAASYIKDSGASIIGVQELLPAMKKDIETLLGGYSVLGLGRKKNLTNEHSDIIIKDDDMDVQFYKTFWLSKYPEKFGSRSYFAIFPRICTVAEVELKQSGRRIRVFNTHFDHICWLSRELGVDIIMRYMSEYQKRDPLPVILMGDFNAKPDSKPVRKLRENRHGYDNIRLLDVYSVCEERHGLHNTHHGFKGKIKDRKQPIDYIFVSDDFEVIDSKIDVSKIEGRFPSDHFPITATLRLRK